MKDRFLKLPLIKAKVSVAVENARQRHPMGGVNSFFCGPRDTRDLTVRLQSKKHCPRFRGNHVPS